MGCSTNADGAAAARGDAEAGHAPFARQGAEHAEDREGRPSVLISNGAAPMTSVLPVVLSWSCGRACGLMYRGAPKNCPDASTPVPIHSPPHPPRRSHAFTFEDDVTNVITFHR